MSGSPFLYAWGAAALLVTTLMSQAGDRVSVSDLRFHVSDPFPVELAAVVTPPSGVDASGLVAVTTTSGGDPNPWLWDSTTGEVIDLLPEYADWAHATGVNWHGVVSGHVLFSKEGAQFSWPVTWNTSIDPVIDTVLPVPDPPLYPFGWGPRNITDSGFMIATGGGAYNGWSIGWDAAGVPLLINNSGLVTPYDINDLGRAVVTIQRAVPKPYTIDPPYGEEGLTALALPTTMELGFPADTAGALAINRQHEIVGHVQGLRCVRWNADGTYEILPRLVDGYWTTVVAGIADNGIIAGRDAAPFPPGSYSVLWDPATLEPSSLDDLIDPDHNPLEFVFAGGGVSIGGIDSNAAYTRVAAIGFSFVLGEPRWVVLTAITAGRTECGHFECGSLAGFSITGSGTAGIVDDPHAGGNRVLELRGTVAIHQPVSTPEEPFDIAFVADVLVPNSPDAVLNVLLGGTIVAQFTAADLTSGELTQRFVSIDDIGFLGVAGIDLEFAWNDPGGAGPGTTALIIDDIVFQDAPPPACAADINDSGAVEFQDLLAILAAWGPCNICPEDLDENGSVDFGDLLSVLSSWGPCA